MTKQKKNIVLIGGGGHCKSCIEVIESTGIYNIIGILDLPSELGKKVLGYEVIGNDDDYLRYREEGCCFLITAGQIKSAGLRRRIFCKLESIGAEIETVIASTAKVSINAKIRKGTIVMHQSFINAGVNIGENCIINTRALVEHDTVIGSHSHLSTNAVVNGDCKVGNEVFIGSASCIANGITLNDNVVIGSGSNVIRNIISEGVYLGNPAKKIANE